jgi:hypothetical protein
MASSTGPDPAVMDAIERGNAVVFFDICLGEGENAAELGRIKLELFVKDVRTVQVQLNEFTSFVILMLILQVVELVLFLLRLSYSISSFFLFLSL